MKVKFALVAVAAATLAACMTNPASRNSSPDQSGKDEAAIRTLLASTEKRINEGDPGFVEVFAQDAIIVAPSAPDIRGYEAIRAMYQGIMQQASMTVHFSTEEVAVAGGLAYEHGTYTLRLVDRKTGKVLQDVRNKHVHILKRQPDGSWKTWRMMVNSAEPPPTAKEH